MAINLFGMNSTMKIRNAIFSDKSKAYVTVTNNQNQTQNGNRRQMIKTKRISVHKARKNRIRKHQETLKRYQVVLIQIGGEPLLSQCKPTRKSNITIKHLKTKTE